MVSKIIPTSKKTESTSTTTETSKSFQVWLWTKIIKTIFISISISLPTTIIYILISRLSLRRFNSLQRVNVLWSWLTLFMFTMMFVNIIRLFWNRFILFMWQLVLSKKFYRQTLIYYFTLWMMFWLLVTFIIKKSTRVKEKSKHQYFRRIINKKQVKQEKILRTTLVKKLQIIKQFKQKWVIKKKFLFKRMSKRTQNTEHPLKRTKKYRLYTSFPTLFRMCKKLKKIIIKE